MTRRGRDAKLPEPLKRHTRRNPVGKTLDVLWRDRFALDNPALQGANADPAVERLLAHRSQRLYTEDPVPEAVLDTLLAAGLSAASKSDMQQVSLIRIADRAVRGRIGALIPAMPWIVQAPEFFIVCGDNRRIRRVCALRGLAYANDTMDAVLNAAIDAAIVMQQMVCAAEIMGLGCCHISHVRDHVDEIAEMLAIPDHVFPIAGLCVGYPAREGFRQRAPRAVGDGACRPLRRLAAGRRGRRLRPPPPTPATRSRRRSTSTRSARHARLLRLVGGQGAPDGGRRQPHHAGLSGEGRLRAGLRGRAAPLTSGRGRVDARIESAAVCPRLRGGLPPRHFDRSRAQHGGVEKPCPRGAGRFLHCAPPALRSK